jgi:predicted RNase H-like nuclease
VRPRSSSVQNAPSRDVLNGLISLDKAGLDAVSATMLPRYREVATEMSPYRQRVVYEGHPEMSFYQLRKESPLRRSKRILEGREERREILEEKIPGIDKVLDAELDRVPQKHLLDASALLWSARRIFGRAAKRVPVEAEWDSEGLRMEIVY